MSPERQAWLAGVGAGLGILHGARHAVVAIDPARAILTRNQAGADLLARGDLVREREGLLAAADSTSDVALSLALRELRLGDRSGVSLSRVIPLVHAPTGRRVAARLTAVGADGPQPADPIAVLAVFEPNACRRADPARLAAAYDLTPAESRVAALIADGLAPKDAARELGVAPSTVRTQVKRLFEKTGAHRQADLVRLLMLADEI